MQNNESNKFTRFWKTKGYYILLGLCAVAVGVSGYFFVTGAVQEQQAVEQTLAATVTDQDQGEAAEETPDSQEESRQEEQTPVQPGDDARQTAADETAVQTVEQPVLPVSGAVLQDYAMDHLTYNPTTQDWRVHNGVDLTAQLGQAVKAARSGTVTAVYADDYLGTTVVIRHEGGYTSHYCNLEPEVAVTAGETVTVGQTVGTVGNTAILEAASEPHLHFEVYLNGEPADPAGFLY